MRSARTIASFVFFFALLSALIFPGCRKNDISSEGSVPVPPDLVTKINSSVSGFVTDQNGAVIYDAQVNVGGKTVITNEHGYFEVNDVPVVADAATVSVTRNGYFKLVKTYIARKDKKAFLRIRLMRLNTAGIIDATTGGNVSLPDGLKVILPAGAVVNALTNAAYNGQVTVSAKWLDPSAPDVNLLMPGDLRGVNTDGNVRLLTTYGMAAIQLTGASGEALQVAPGKKAQLSFPIPASFTASAPASIPLWYFDDNTGLWKEEGAATRTGNTYTGEVSHFSFWNVDLPLSYVQFDCTVKGPGGMPVPGALVKITEVSNPANFRYGHTDISGYVNGAVPNNTQLEIKVYSSISCVNASYTQLFSTTTTNISMGITVPAGEAATISGKVFDCSNNPVTNGALAIKRGDTYTNIPLNTAGAYQFDILLCGSNTISVTGKNATAQQQSPPLNFTVTPGSNTLPDIQACGVSAIPFIEYTIGGTNYFYAEPTDTVMVTGTPTPPNGYIIRPMVKATSQLPATVVVPSDNLTAGAIVQVGFSAVQLPAGSTPGAPLNLTITEYGAPGEFMSGYFTAPFINPSPVPTVFTVSCSFRVRRF